MSAHWEILLTHYDADRERRLSSAAHLLGKRSGRWHPYLSKVLTVGGLSNVRAKKFVLG